MTPTGRGLSFVIPFREAKKKGLCEQERSVVTTQPLKKEKGPGIKKKATGERRGDH